MRTGKKIIIVILFFLGLLLVLITSNKNIQGKDYYLKPQNIRLEPMDEELYEELRQYIDDGDYMGFADRLLSDLNYENAFILLFYNNPDAINDITIDILTDLLDSDRIQDIVKLRKKGFIPNSCLLEYWEDSGISKPLNKNKNVDVFLVNELFHAFNRNKNMMSELITMRNSGIIDDLTHEALTNAFGFDYMDGKSFDNDGLVHIEELNDEDIREYENVNQAIDDGNSKKIIDRMLYGEISISVYEYLIQEDKEIVEYVIAEGLYSLSKENKYKDILSLRQEGFVSDTCFEIYWEMKGIDRPDNNFKSKIPAYIDALTVYEMIRIYNQEEGKVIIDYIWETGILDDNTYDVFNALV